MPGRGRADAVPPGIDLQKIRPPIGSRFLRPRERVLELARLLDGLGLDAERLRGLGEIDVRVAVVAGHVAAALELAAAEMPDAVALVVVALVVEHDVDDRRAVARLAPQRLRA